MSNSLAANKRLSLKISVIVERDEDGSFYAHAPALKGLHVDGATEQEALHNAMEAVQAYLESLSQHGDPLPIGPDLTVHDEEVIPEVPPGAFLHSLTIPWPSLEMPGTSFGS